MLNLFQAMIREADIDNDGKISFEEFRTVMKTWNIPIEKKTVHSKFTFFYLSISLDLSNQKVSCSCSWKHTIALTWKLEKKFRISIGWQIKTWGANWINLCNIPKVSENLRESIQLIYCPKFIDLSNSSLTFTYLYLRMLTF